MFVLTPTESRPRPTAISFGFAGIVAEPTRHQREDLSSIGLLAAQVMMAAVHARDSQKVDATDQEILRRTAELFRSSAARIRFVQSRGQGTTPRSMLSTGLNTDILFADQSPSDPEKIAKYYDEIAEKLDLLAACELPAEDVQTVYSMFQSIADRARAQAGSSGHHASSGNTSPF